MTANKHTPGPWSFYTEPQPNGCPVVGSKGLLVCMLGHSVRIPDQKETALANARLIASAPELLEALIEAVECGMVPISSAVGGGASAYSAQVRCADKIRAAIAKATGESP